MSAALTGTQIIEAGLQKAGNPSITDLAETWLANGLDRLYEDFAGWPFLQASDSGTVSKGATSVSLPSDFSDFWNRKSLRLEDPTTKARHPLELLVPDVFDVITNPDSEGTPDSAIVDLTANTWRPYPLPNKAYTWRLRYRFKPARLTDFSSKPTFPNDQILVQLIFAEALDHEDDERAKKEFVVLSKMIQRYKGGKNLSPNRGGKTLLNPSVFSPITSYR